MRILHLADIFDSKEPRDQNWIAKLCAERGYATTVITSNYDSENNPRGKDWFQESDDSLKPVEIVRTVGLEAEVVFLGQVPQQSMSQIYSGASVFVLPTIYKEPFGIAAVEALSSGVPVIASDIDGLRVIVKDGKVGYLVQPKDVAGLASNTIKVLTNEGAE